VRNAENTMDWGEAASLGVLRLASISSIHSTTGATASMERRARWKAASGLP
jgi:hypothetical protein